MSNVQSVFDSVCKSGFENSKNSIFCEAKLMKGTVSNKVVFYLYDNVNDRQFENHVCLTDEEYDVLNDNFDSFWEYSEKYAENA